MSSSISRKTSPSGPKTQPSRLARTPLGNTSPLHSSSDDAETAKIRDYFVSRAPSPAALRETFSPWRRFVSRLPIAFVPKLHSVAFLQGAVQSLPFTTPRADSADVLLQIVEAVDNVLEAYPTPDAFSKHLVELHLYLTIPAVQSIHATLMSLPAPWQPITEIFTSYLSLASGTHSEHAARIHSESASFVALVLHILYCYEDNAYFMVKATLGSKPASYDHRYKTPCYLKLWSNDIVDADFVRTANKAAMLTPSLDPRPRPLRTPNRSPSPGFSGIQDQDLTFTTPSSAPQIALKTKPSHAPPPLHTSSSLTSPTIILPTKLTTSQVPSSVSNAPSVLDRTASLLRPSHCPGCLQDPGLRLSLRV